MSCRGVLISNARDKLRAAHDPMAVRSYYHASIRLQPPFVSFIALLGGDGDSSASLDLGCCGFSRQDPRATSLR
jgi:hypothetical protein